MKIIIRIKRNLAVCSFPVIIFMLSITAGYAAEFQWLVEPCFEYARSFSDDLAAVKINKKYGYINTKGEVIIEAKYDEVSDFYDGAAMVIINSTSGYINKKGILLIRHQPDEDIYFGESLAIIKIDRQYGYITKKGIIQIMPSFSYALSFNGGLAAVMTEGKYGFINKKGMKIIKPVFDGASVFSEGLAAVKVKGRWGYINKKGKILIRSIFYEAGDFSEGLACVKTNNGTGYINKRGQFVVKPQFEDGKEFYGAIAAVKLYGKWGYIRRIVSSKALSVKKSTTVDRKYKTDKTGKPVRGSTKSKGRTVKSAAKSLENNKYGVNISQQKNKEPEPENNEQYNFSKIDNDSGFGIKSDNKILIIEGMEYVGILSEVNEGQVVVIDDTTGEKYFLGAWCITGTESDRVYIEAGTPFSTVAKCDIHNGFYEKVKPGMKVYKKNK